MKRILIAATLALLLWGAPAFAGPFSDLDLDGVSDQLDNCSEKANPNQDDTDGDDCGNLCDADYTQDGIIGIADFGQFSICFNLAGCALQQHTEPVDADRVVNFADFGYFATVFNVTGAVGPSGTTAGTVACP